MASTSTPTVAPKGASSNPVQLAGNHGVFIVSKPELAAASQLSSCTIITTTTQQVVSPDPGPFTGVTRKKCMVVEC